MKTAEQNAVAFQEFYERKLAELGLREVDEGDALVIVKPTSERFLFFFSREGRPQYLGHILEKPRIDESENIRGMFRATSALHGPIWNLAAAIEQELGIDCGIDVIYYPSRSEKTA